MDGAAGPSVPTTIGTKELEAANSPDGQKTPTAPTTPEDDIPQAPGALTGPASVIPDWYKTGWREVSGIDAPVPEGAEHDKAIISMFISDQVCIVPRFIT